MNKDDYIPSTLTFNIDPSDDNPDLAVVTMNPHMIPAVYAPELVRFMLHAASLYVKAIGGGAGQPYSHTEPPTQS